MIKLFFVMTILLGETNFWTFEDVVNIKDTDFGAFRYHDKRTENLYAEGKRSYGKKRGMVCVPQNKKANKLKDSIKYLEEQLKDHSVVYCQWCDHCVVQLLLSSGLLIHIQINLSTGDIQKMIFDKYLVGKVLDHMSDVIITKSHLMCTYNDNQVTLVHFTKPKRHMFEKMSRLDPKLVLFDLSGPSGRRLDKKIQFNKTGDLIVVWWKSTVNEVFPWSPVVKEHDRANVHLYRLIGIKIELLCFLRTEFDPLCVTFSTYHENMIHSVEQKVSRKGEVTIEWRVYEVSQQGKLQRIAVTSVPLPTHTSCIKFSPNHDMLLLCCIDGSVTLHDQARGTNNTVKAAFIPTLASWHSDGMAFTISNERGQFQHYDISLTCLRSQILNEDTTPANILDLSSYFSRNQPALLRMEWSKGITSHDCPESYGNGDSLFLLLFERGPLGIIKFIEGSNLSGDILVRRHLNLSQVERAISLLLAMNWDTYPEVCMHSLNQILNYLFKSTLTPEREGLIQTALGSFHVPITPISQTVQEEYGEEVRDLTRRFFHHLLRHRLFEKAFRLAIDLNDHDLFMDIHFYALITNDTEMATAAKGKAETILVRSNSCSSTHSTCSRRSCSLCSSSESQAESESYSEESETEDSPRREKLSSTVPLKRNNVKSVDSNIPPLPVLHPHHYNRKSLISTSFNAVESPTINSLNSDKNLMSTAFNVPSVNHLTSEPCDNSPTNVSRNNDPLTSPYSNPNLCATSTNNSARNLPLFNDVIGDLMSTSFSNNSISPIFNHSSNTINDKSFDNKSNTISSPTFNNVSSNAKISTILQDTKNLTTTLFNNPTYDTELFDNTSNKSSSFSNIESPHISTPFSNLISNSMSKSYGDLYNGFNSTSKYSMNIPPILYGMKPPGVNASPSNTLVSMLFNDSISTDKLSTTPFFDPNGSLMSTSFSNFDKELTSDFGNTGKDTFAPTSINPVDNPIHNHSPIKSIKKHCPMPVPPPPSIKNSYNYVHSLPNKSYQLSHSTLGLANIDEPVQRFQSRLLNSTAKVLHRQNSVSTILQNHHKRNNKFQSTKTYRVNYDLDFVPFYGSCDNLDSHAPINHLRSNSQLQTKLRESRHLKHSFLQNCANLNISKEQKFSSNISPQPIINSSFSKPKSNTQIPPAVETLTSSEKPKVKFSDTVTHILVPGSGQPYRPVQKRSVTQLHPMDPKRELAESLPLCLGNEDYLKDFQPLSKDSETDSTKEPHSKQPDESAKIKIVHFGLL
ncbi:WD repeat-containing and planar cell polarity effector protein fritz isoform X1 [Neodiprion pinetum]|uniref:WD repeat-containing and planar cell polarity effector protein fritz isoform X1 n=2 Tax=Neodiprion pinetum TaxID=441929 RepID=UPI001EDEAEBF|nr:WD repeat-containing and planar cell polarity effector protein fritz isoform X1 [Neodiprion pinetum]